MRLTYAQNQEFTKRVKLNLDIEVTSWVRIVWPVGDEEMFIGPLESSAFE